MKKRPGLAHLKKKQFYEDRLEIVGANSWRIRSLVMSPEAKHWHQCDQIGRVLKVLGNKFPCKSSSNSLQQFGLLSKIAFFTLNWYVVDTFWATFGENWPFYSNIWSHWLPCKFTLHSPNFASMIYFGFLFWAVLLPKC